VRIHIEATDLPGRTCGPWHGFPGYDDVHVGVQRRDRPGELLGLHPGDAPSATWTFECTATPTPAGVDVRGPYIQGRPAGRFVYLSWGVVDAAGAFTMFRRAKLMLEAAGPGVLDAAVRSGLLLARLRLTDAHGQPLCAQVRPPLIEWSAPRGPVSRRDPGVNRRAAAAGPDLKGPGLPSHRVRLAGRESEEMNSETERGSWNDVVPTVLARVPDVRISDASRAGRVVVGERCGPRHAAPIEEVFRGAQRSGRR
jgi:hypothetical protein